MVVVDRPDRSCCCWHAPRFAPAGVYFVAAALVLRDAAQYGLGRAWVLAVMAAGVVLSVLVAGPGLALASGAAFALSESADFALFTRMAPRWGWAVFAGGMAGAVVDSLAFLGIAQWTHVPGITLAFMPGQVLGKWYGILVAAGVISWRRRSRLAPLVGLGSVCRRQDTAAADRIVRALQPLRLHGFGVKITGLRRAIWWRDRLLSSLAARGWQEELFDMEESA